MASHVALLGDSVIDNAAYTRGEPDVTTHLSRLLPEGWRATSLAVDGARIAGVHDQLRRMPGEISHLVLSAGGNDALANIDLLNTAVRSTAEALLLFESRIAPFERNYRSLLRALQALERPLTVCTIYNGRLPSESEARCARMALMMFNDAILRAAFDHGASIIELRTVCSEDSDFANPIEPSGSGGAKIARAVVHALELSREHRAPVSRVFTR